jgi:DNA processing protein
MAAFAKSGARLVSILSSDYPLSLLQIDDPPPFLYVKGSLVAEELAVAVVGSRRSSDYGRMVTEKLSRELAEQGVTIVSGLARGVDTAAHRGALKGGGRTIGVLGCGIDVVYPSENAQLSVEIESNGAVISEFPMGTAPLAENFPRRNRIVSGLSKGVLVVEAAEGSGSLITARLALDQGRDVFAVPGSIVSKVSRGTNLLIRDGAKLVLSVEDILDELPHGKRSPGQQSPKKQSPELLPDEQTIWAVVAGAPLHIDEITVKSKLTAGEVSAILLRLELKGGVTQLPGKVFAVS